MGLLRQCLFELRARQGEHDALDDDASPIEAQRVQSGVPLSGIEGTTSAHRTPGPDRPKPTGAPWREGRR